MLEPPADLSEDALAASLSSHYGLAVADLTFLPIGHDSLAWVYRVQTADGAPLFLKVRKSVANEAALLVLQYLRDHHDVSGVAPIPTTEGSLWSEVANYVLILYPFIAGNTGMERRLSARQWVDYGAILRRIHGTALPPELSKIMRRETFVPPDADVVRELDASIGNRTFDDAAEQVVAQFWQTRRADIHAMVERAEDLGRRLAQADRPLVLCHADIHTGNVMVDPSGRVWIVDWDETVLAPRERDLMFAIGGGISTRLVGPQDEELFLQGYGSIDLDPLALSYYRYSWAVADIGAYGSQVFLRPDLGPADRQESVERFMSLFRPGEIVSLALGSSSQGLETAHSGG